MKENIVKSDLEAADIAYKKVKTLVQKTAKLENYSRHRQELPSWTLMMMMMMMITDNMNPKITIKPFMSRVGK